MERRSLVAVEVGVLARLAVIVTFATGTTVSSSFRTGGGDVARYAVYATGTSAPDLATWFPWEYPALARALMAAIPGRTNESYVLVFALMCLTVDIAVLWWLGRRTGPGSPSTGVWIWALAIPLLGVLPYTRYDLLVVALVMVALTQVFRRPVPAGLLLSLAIGLKWWPLAVVPLLVAAAPRGRRLAALAAGVGPWLVAEAVGLWVWGSRSLTEPISWLMSRGVQVEAPVALPQLWQAWGGGPGPEWLHNTMEFPSVGWFPTVVGLIGALLVVVVLVLSTRALAAGSTDPYRLLLAAATVVALLVSSGRVLSPQYVVWLVGLLAVLGTVPYSPLRPWWVGAAAALSGLTTMVFPLGFDALVTGALWPLLLLTLRNVVLLALAVALLASWWQTGLGRSRPDQSPIASSDH